MPKKLTREERKAEELAADQRDADALTRFFRLILSNGLRMNCSSIRAERLKRKGLGAKIEASPTSRDPGSARAPLD